MRGEPGAGIPESMSQELLGTEAVDLLETPDHCGFDPGCVEEEAPEAPGATSGCGCGVMAGLLLLGPFCSGGASAFVLLPILPFPTTFGLGSSISMSMSSLPRASDCGESLPRWLLALLGTVEESPDAVPGACVVLDGQAHGDDMEVASLERCDASLAKYVGSLDKHDASLLR